MDGVRRRVARHRAVDGAGEPRARRRRRRRHRRRADPLRGARADAAHPLRARGERRAAGLASSGPSKASCPRCSRTTRCTGRATARRIDADIARYHHIGTAHGWVDVDGDRTEFDRRHVGRRRVITRGACGTRSVCRSTTSRPRRCRRRRRRLVIWSPILMTRPDGSHYGAAHVLPTRTAFGDWQRIELQGGFEHADGRTRALRRARPRARRRSGEPPPPRRRAARDDERRLRARPHDHRALGDRVPPRRRAVLRLRRSLARRVARAARIVDGEYIADCTTYETAAPPAPTARLHRAGRRPGRRRCRLSATCRASSPARIPISASTSSRRSCERRDERGAHGRAAR